MDQQVEILKMTSLCKDACNVGPKTSISSIEKNRLKFDIQMHSYGCPF